MDFQISFHDWLVGLRRFFHQFPELSYKEEKTAAKIAETLKGLGAPFQTGIGKTGVVAALTADHPGPVVALRADMDALPLEEKNDVPYKSRHSGVMHACGHDAHVTIALGVVRLLVEDGWQKKGRGRILFIFQPAEEGGAGARAMLQEGVLDREPIEAIFAGHLHPENPLGQIAMAPGVSNAASDSIYIRITGKGGHGAQPQFCVDPIVAGAHLVVQLQSIISRNLHPLDGAVLTVGRFHSGTASNIIPDEAVLTGTLRTLAPSVRETVLDRLKQLLKGLETAFNVSVDLHVTPGYPLLTNDQRIVDWTVMRSRELLGVNGVQLETPRMGAEDFAYFLERYPGVLIRIGCHDPEKGFTHALHSPYFTFDERVLDLGVRLFAHLLTSYADSGMDRTK
jgi:amidohydrolase